MSATALTPFERARGEFRDVFTDSARRERLWQVLFLGAALYAAIVTMAYIRMSGRAHITPYVVQVDSFDRAITLGPADTLEEPEDRLVVYQLAEWLQNARSVYADPHAQRSQTTKAYALLTSTARDQLNAYFGQPENDPLLLGQKLNREVEVQSILPVSEEAWHLEWVEKTFPTRMNARATSEVWQATLRIQIEPPRTVETIRANPMGIWIRDVHWTRLGVP